MPRQPLGQTQTIMRPIRWEESEWVRIQRVAEEKGVSAAELVRTIVKAGLEWMEEEE